VQVHDASLVALMRVHNVDHLLTLNPTDFARFVGLHTFTPDQLLASQAKQ
jgi:hypothetical protein